MTSGYFIFIGALLIIVLNFYILRLYKKCQNLKSKKEGLEYNSTSLFNQTSIGGWMLRFPFPIFSELQDDTIQKIIKKHNRLTYLYYGFLVFLLWYIPLSV